MTDRLARALVHRLLRLSRGGVLELRERDRPARALRRARSGRAAARGARGPLPRLLPRAAARERRPRRGAHGRPVVEPRPRRARAAGRAQRRGARSPAPLAAPADRPGAGAGARAQHDPPQPRPDRRSLRPRQRPLRALPRRADDVLLGDLPHGGLDPRGRGAAQARAGVRQARPRPGRPPAGDRHRLGRAGRPRRQRITAAA